MFYFKNWQIIWDIYNQIYCFAHIWTHNVLFFSESTNTTFSQNTDHPCTFINLHFNEFVFWRNVYLKTSKLIFAYTTIEICLFPHQKLLNIFSKFYVQIERIFCATCYNIDIHCKLIVSRRRRMRCFFYSLIFYYLIVTCPLTSTAFE